MIQEQVVVGPLQCNCIILGCERTREAVIIDPGDEPNKIISLIENQNLKPKYILHTHAHFDHVAGTAGVREKFNAPTCLHPGDQTLYDNLPMQGRMFGMEFGNTPKLEKLLADEEILTFGDHRLQIVHVPGHSPGSVSFKLLDGSEHIFTGDTLFHRSIGRADLWGGDGRQLIHSIKDRLFRFDDDTQVFPGHGEATRIGEEKRLNPFLT